MTTNEAGDGGKNGDLLLLLMTRQREGEGEHVRSIYCPSGVSANYRLISMADDPLLAYQATSLEGIKTLDWVMNTLGTQLLI